VGDFDALVGDIEEFVTGRRETDEVDVDRVLATVLFADIVDSTPKAAEAGDRQWRRWLDEHDRIGRQTVDKHRGRWIKGTGDGLLATFDGPGRAVRCALHLVRRYVRLGFCCAQVCTSVRLKYAGMMSAVSRSTRRRASWLSRRPAKSGSRASLPN